MRAGWLWLLALGLPLAGGVLTVVVYSDTFTGALILAGWPLTALLAGAAMWSSISAAHRIAKPVGAVVAALAVSLFVAPFLFFAGYFLSVLLFGHDDRAYL